MKLDEFTDARPYQIMCLICRLGRRGRAAYYFEGRLDGIQRKIRQNRDCPVCLRCNVESTFKFQNPGHKYDTPEGKLFNIRRDLTILQKLGLLPGSIIPAADLIKRFVRDGISSTDGVCGFGNNAIGCKFAKSGNYERGIKICYDSLIQIRSEDELAECKTHTAKKLYSRKRLDIRPHHLMCIGCVAGDKKTEDFKYLKEDHLFEVLEICRNNPETPIKLISGPCMICAPCPGYFPDTGFCSQNFCMGLRDQKKDIDVLVSLGLNYGDVLPAYKLFDLLFEKISSTAQICGFGNAIKTGPAWSICGGENKLDGSLEFKKARKAGLGIKGVKRRK
ncbi:MAG: hypothetical protein A2017_01815 [Lentisphaerae bacterium GWF2_44_16]|nr:MAG: hypothetical protein A2017_01815 [Lentisphaerae bacterium GWF2_44_16]